MSIAKANASLLMLFAFSSPTVSASQAFAHLNRVNFAGNVLENHGEGPEHWVVFFCADWFEPCQGLQDAFTAAARKHGRPSDDDLFSRPVRFADVDCAVDKVLCNTQEVETYPTVVHYHKGNRVSDWSYGGRAKLDLEAKQFNKWLTKEMGRESQIALVEDQEAAATPTRDISGAGPMLVLLVAAALWICRFAEEVKQAVQFTRDILGERNSDVKLKQKQEHQDPDLEDSMDNSVVIRCLPDSWANDRGSIEL